MKSSENKFSVSGTEYTVKYRQEGKDIAVDTYKDGNMVNSFANLREFTYFINMLTDLDDFLLKEEEKINEC